MLRILWDMNLIGDLERLFATSIYPLRVPIAIAVVIGLIGLTVLARRRGWFAAARRHPGRTASLIVVALAIGLPAGWYFASPLFIRTELIEPAPAGATGAATDAPSAAPIVDAMISVATGTFRGADDFHFGEGTASIIETAPGRYTLRFEAFSVQNGPDLFVYLSPAADGYTDGALELGTLKATDGAFGYELPEGTDPADFASAVIWCKQFAVLFAVAPLTAS
jgi:hypothetical protein